MKRARRFRRAMTEPEVILWSRLRGRLPDRPVFRRQVPLGGYVLDFYCPAAKLVVEVDGHHHFTEAGEARDERRDAWLKARGLEVVRVGAARVFAAAGEVADGLILLACERAGAIRPTIARSATP
ncbi:MAG TPA: endonuclease domain-containing protein [Phenylobacterium sp.]